MTTLPPPPAPTERDENANERSLFRRHFVLIAAAHLLAVLLLFALGIFRSRPVPEQVLWLEGGAFGGNESGASEPEPEPEPAPPEPEPPLPTPSPVEAQVPSEIVEPRATPVPATPKPATPKPATPKSATPKPATPKPATPKATPKASPKPATSPKPAATPGKKSATTPSPDKPKGEGSGESKDAKDAKNKGNGGGDGSGKGTGKSGSGTGGASQFGWYIEMLRDRYYSRWDQPIGIGQDLIATVKMRIMKDGTISKAEIVKSSGNPQMDESVATALQKVHQIDPLPAGLGNGEFYEINVNFKTGE